MDALGVAQSLLAPEGHVPEICCISISAESPVSSIISSCEPSFCKVLILLLSPVISRFHVMSSASQSISNILELPNNIRSASNLSALAV